jgi:hypothetical protein
MPGSAASVWPLQSLSIPSQISVLGPRYPSQTRPPFTQMNVPALQAPIVGELGLGLQVPPVPLGLSSMTPSQSSSMPLQVSAVPVASQAPKTGGGTHSPIFLPMLCR